MKKNNTFLNTVYALSISMLVVGPVIWYLNCLLSFAFAFTSINCLIYLPSTFANGALDGLVAVAFSYGTKHSPVKTAFGAFCCWLILTLASLIFQDVHGYIAPIQVRATIGTACLNVVTGAIVGYVVPIVLRRLN